MTLLERIRYYAKAVMAIVGAVVTFVVLFVAVTDDGTLDGGDISELTSAAVVAVVTVIGVIKKTNYHPDGTPMQ